MTLDGLLLLIALIDGERIALPASAIESVVELDGLTPVPRAAPHVVGLAPLRSRVLTVIDSRIAIGRPPAPPADAPTAVVVTLDGHGYAVLVDAVEDVVEAAGVTPLSAGVAGEWRRVSTGLVEVADRALLLVDPAALISGPAALAA